MNTRATITINGPDDRQKIATWARNVDAGTVVTFRKKSRSTEQNAKLHAMLGEVSSQVEWYGQKLDLDDWKDMFTASLRHARVVPGIDKGTFVPLGMHTSTLTIEEMSNLIELIYAFGADPEHPVVFKDPKETTEPGSPSPEPDATESLSSVAEGVDMPPSTPSTLADASVSEARHDDAEAEAADATAPNASAASNLSADQRAKLIEAATKFMKLAQEQISFEARLQFLESREADWRDVIDPANWPKLESLATAARAVINSKRTPAQEFSFMAEVLGCSVADIGGSP